MSNKTQCSQYGNATVVTSLLPATEESQNLMVIEYHSYLKKMLYT